MPKPPIVDREFAARFLRAVDRPFDYGVYFLFHDWWAEAPQEAIDDYQELLVGISGAPNFLEQRWLADPLSLEDLDGCAPGTLGHAYRSFIVDNDLAANLSTDYRAFNEELQSNGTLDRLPEDISYMIVRGFQIHDFLHVLTGSTSEPMGELRMAAFHFAQMKFPYHAMRMAVTAGHLAFVSPKAIVPVMDAISEGWMLGRAAENLHFTRWEEQLERPVDDIRADMAISAPAGGSGARDD